MGSGSFLLVGLPQRLVNSGRYSPLWKMSVFLQNTSNTNAHHDFTIQRHTLTFKLHLELLALHCSLDIRTKMYLAEKVLLSLILGNRACSSQSWG